jgi:hypothetical protein
LGGRKVRVGPVTDAAGAKGEPTLPRDHLTAMVTPSGVSPRFVTVSACIDPDRGEDLDRGQYVGALLVDAPARSGVGRSSVALSVSVHDNHAGLALLAVLIGVLAGLVIRSAGDMRKMGGQTDRERVRTYIYSLSFLVMVTGGLLGGAGAYLTIYANDANATTDTGSLIALAGAAFTATIAAKTLTDIGTPSEKEIQAGAVDGRRESI